MDGLWATKSEGLGLIVRAFIASKLSSLCDPDPLTSQTDDMQSHYRALHYSASRGNDDDDDDDNV